MKTLLTVLITLTSLHSWAFENPVIRCSERGITIYTAITYELGTCYETGDIWKDCDEIKRSSSFTWLKGELIFHTSSGDLILNPKKQIAPIDCKVDWHQIDLFREPLSLKPFSKTHRLEKDVLYTVLNSHHDLTSGVAMLFVGESTKASGKNFRERLKKHVQLVAKETKAFGKLKYYVYATDEIEIAILQWPNEKAMNFAYENIGEKITSDANEFLNPILWRPLGSLPGGKITRGFLEQFL